MFGKTHCSKKCGTFRFRESPNARLLAVYSGPLEIGGQLDVFGPGDADVEIVGGRAELAERKLLALGSAGVDAILRHVDDVVSYVKPYDRVIDAIVRADAGDDDMVPARAEIEFPQLLFHGRLIEAVVGILFYDRFLAMGLSSSTNSTAGLSSMSEYSLPKKVNSG